MVPTISHHCKIIMCPEMRFMVSGDSRRTVPRQPALATISAGLTQLRNAGSMPGAKQSMILVASRLTEVRGFSDFFSEFFTALRKTQFPPNMRMVVLCNRPNYELRAFQVRSSSPIHAHPTHASTIIVQMLCKGDFSQRLTQLRLQKLVCR